MAHKKRTINISQDIFRNMLIGTLLYSVVLGFFNDYTDILWTRSYSTTFLAAFVMQILTYLTFALKDVIKSKFKGKEGKKYKIGLGFSLWLVLFLSKFVFLAVIDFVFGDAIAIRGFFGLMGMIVCMTLAAALVEHVDKKLALNE